MLAADKYQLNGLKRICGQHLYLNINDSNALKAFSLGDKLNDSQLLNRSMAYIRNEIKDLIQTEDWNQLIKPQRRTYAKDISQLFAIINSYVMSKFLATNN